MIAGEPEATPDAEAPAPPGTARQVLAAGLALRVTRYPLQVLFVAVVPSLLGADAYGAYATCSAIWALAARATDVGTEAIFGRLAPGLPPEATRRLGRQVLWTRLALGAAPGTVLVALLWTPRREDPWLFGLVVLAIALFHLQDVLFAALYGRGQITRYMARDPLAAALSVSLVVAGYLSFGLVGAVAGLASVQAALVALGLAWARPRAADLAPPRDVRGLGPTLRFEIAAALPATLTVAALKIGTPLLSRAGWPTREVAGFDLAVHVLTLVIALAAYPFLAWLPALGRTVDAGREAEAYRAVRRIVGGLAAGAAALVVALAAAGEGLVRWLLGEGFVALYANLLVLIGAGVFPVVVAQAAQSLAVLLRRPQVAVAPAVVFAAVSGTGALLLAPGVGALGAAGALLAGLVAQAAVLATSTPGLVSLVRRPVGRAAAVALPAFVLAALETAGLVSLPAAIRLGALGLLAAVGARPLVQLARGRA